VQDDGFFVGGQLLRRLHHVGAVLLARCDQHDVFILLLRHDGFSLLLRHDGFILLLRHDGFSLLLGRKVYRHDGVGSRRSLGRGRRVRGFIARGRDKCWLWRLWRLDLWLRLRLRW